MHVSSIGTPKVTITVKNGWATFAPPYYHDLFHDGILDVPARDRCWLPVPKAWSVREAHLDTLVRLVTANYYTEPTVEEAA